MQHSCKYYQKYILTIFVDINNRLTIIKTTPIMTTQVGNSSEKYSHYELCLSFIGLLYKPFVQ